LAVLAVAATACSTGSSGAVGDSQPSVALAGTEEAPPSPGADDVSAGGDEGRDLPGQLAIAAAVDEANRATSGRWVFRAEATLLGGRVQQAFHSVRDFDRDRDRSALEVRYQITDAAEPPDVAVRGALSGLVTEVVRDGGRTLVRLGGESSTDDSWYDLGDVELHDLAAWHLLAVDPQSDRIPLLGMFGQGGVELIARIAGSSGRTAYPIRVPVPAVVGLVSQDAPSLAELLPAQLPPEISQDSVPGTVVLSEDGRLVSAELDLGALFTDIGASSTDPHETELFRSADVTVRTEVQLDQRTDIIVPARHLVIPPASILDDIASDGLVVGDCLPPGTDLDATVLYLVSCDEAHTLEVFLVTDGWGPDQPYPGLDVVRAWADQACMDAFGDFVGRPFDESIHSLATVTPLPLGWETGDRQVTCLAESFLPRRGTLAGIAQ